VIERRVVRARVKIDPTVLPDKPDEWGSDILGFRQRWLPGAFGDRTTIEGVYAYKVEDDVWLQDAHGIWRTIRKARICRVPYWMITGEQRPRWRDRPICRLRALFRR
jgi:hypothetical protein